MPSFESDPSRRTLPTLREFAQRVLVVVIIGALALAAWRLVDLAVLLFAAVLIAIGLHSGARFMSRRTRVGHMFALGVVVVLLVAALSAALWFFGTFATEQLGEVAQQVPAGVQMLVGRVREYSYGRFVLDQVQVAGAASATGWAASLLAAVASGLALGAGYAVLTFFAAVYLAAQPGRYRRMCLRILPRAYDERVTSLFNRTTVILRRWMAGQLVVMVVIGVLSGLGLWALGIKAPFALGLVGGLLTFIPYVGAILAAVPATLVALTQGPAQAGMVLMMYVGVHFVEGNLITPLVQAEATELPPVLALFSTVAFSVLFGPSSVLLAAPLMLFFLVAIEVLWVEQSLK